MLKKIKYTFILCCVMMASCSDNSIDVAIEYYITIDPTEKIVDCTINEFPVRVESNHQWSVRTNDDWVSIVPTDSIYYSDTILHIKVKENTSREPRNTQIEFLCDTKNSTLSITQEGFSPYIEISDQELIFGYRTAEKTIQLTSNCGWYAKADASWITISPSTGLIGNFDMIINVETNDKEESRNSVIYVWNDVYDIEELIHISQNGDTDVNDYDYIDEYGINHGSGVVIRGLSWATVNCGYHAEYYPYGKLYQWGRAAGLGYYSDDYQYEPQPIISDIWRGDNGMEDKSTFYTTSNDSRYGYDWIVEGDNSFWNIGTDENPIKNDHYDPCPKGWRVPTSFEMRSLIEFSQRVWTIENEINGYLIYYSDSDINPEDVESLFFPAGGRLNISDGVGYDRVSDGYYWTSTTNASGASYLYFYSDNYSINSQGSRAGGCLLRCVKE